MTYNPQIPQATDLISNSQGDLLTNFQQLNVVFGNDHYEFNDSANSGENRGLHKQVTIPNVSTTDPTLSAAKTGEFYTKAVGNVVTPFFAGWNGTSTVVYNLLTGSGGGNDGVSGNGWIQIGGVLMKWGRFTGPNGPTNIDRFNYPVGAGIPVFSQIFQVFTQPTQAPGSPDYRCYLVSLDTTGFWYDAFIRTRGNTYSYLAIGAS